MIISLNMYPNPAYCKTGNFHMQEIFANFANFRKFVNLPAREYYQHTVALELYILEIREIFLFYSM